MIKQLAKLTDDSLEDLLITVLSYKGLWHEAEENNLVLLSQTKEEVTDIEEAELKQYLERCGVKFSESNSEYYAEFEC